LYFSFPRVFIARSNARACRARYVVANTSVCPSVTRWHCIETNALIVRLFPPSAVVAWLLRPTVVRTFQREINSLSGSFDYRRGGKICDFWQKSRSISETVRDRPIWLLRITNRKSADLSVTVPMTLTVSEGSTFFLADLSTYLANAHIPRVRAPPSPIFGPPAWAETVWRRATKFGTVTHGGGACILRSSTTPSF